MESIISSCNKLFKTNKALLCFVRSTERDTHVLNLFIFYTNSSAFNYNFVSSMLAVNKKF